MTPSELDKLEELCVNTKKPCTDPDYEILAAALPELIKEVRRLQARLKPDDLVDSLKYSSIAILQSKLTKAQEDWKAENEALNALRSINKLNLAKIEKAKEALEFLKDECRGCAEDWAYECVKKAGQALKEIEEK